MKIFFTFLFLLMHFSCADSETTNQGRLVLTSPENGKDGVYLDAEVVIFFTDTVVFESITSQATTGPCEDDKSIQITSDQFVNCTGGTIIEHSGSSGRKFAFNPKENWDSETTYTVRIGSDIRFDKVKSMAESAFSFTTGTQTRPDET